MRRRFGFTMVELLTVICIIGLLAAMIFPSMSGALAAVRRYICANNLKRISDSTHCWSTEGRTWRLHALVDAGWTGAVARYAGGSFLNCPEGNKEKRAEGKPVEGQIVIRVSPSSSVGIPLVPFTEGGSFKVLKLSNTQWAAIGESKRVTPMPYVPDSNPNEYWWGYDDGAVGTGDYDFQDLAFHVTKNGDGTASVFATGATAGKPELWSVDLTKQYAAWDKINKYHNPGAPGMTFKLDVGEGSDYGMNDADLDMRAGGKVAVMDYLFTAAHSTDDWDVPAWDTNKDGRPDFLRHAGRLNVLYTDGSVKLQDRREVDPVDVQVERSLWQR